MAKKFDYLVEEAMLLTDKKIFGDNEEHEYDVYCQDGRAIAIPAIGELLERPKSPRLLELTYPKKDELTQEQKKKCLEYRGLYVDASMCHVGDICMSLGKIRVIANKNTKFYE